MPDLKPCPGPTATALDFSRDACLKRASGSGEPANKNVGQEASGSAARDTTLPTNLETTLDATNDRDVPGEGGEDFHRGFTTAMKDLKKDVSDPSETDKSPFVHFLVSQCQQ